VVLDSVRSLKRQVVRDVRDHQRDRQRNAEHGETERDQHRTRVRKDPQPALAVPPGVIEEHLGDAPEEERLSAYGQHCDAEELRVERKRDRA
jgi:hypothetical protein